MDLATLMQQAALLNQQQMAQGQQVSDMLAGASQTASETSQVLQQSASDTREAELTRLEGELKTQNARVKVANAYGTNVNAQSDVITPLAELMRQTAVDLTKAQAEVQRIDANSDLLGNPLGWLEDLVRGDEVRGQRDALAQSLDQQSKTAQALNAATQTSIQTQNAITETLTTTSIKQIANVKAADAQVKAANWQVEAAKLGASSVEALSQVGAQNFARMAQMYSLGQQAESMALARAERAERLKDKQAVETELQDITDNINAYNKTYGRPEVPTSFVKRYYGTQGEYGDELRHADVSGMRIRQSGGTEGSLGAKPSEAYMRIESGAVQTPAAWKPSVDVLKEAEAQFNTFLDERDKTTGKTNRESLKGEALKDAFDNQVKDVAARYSKRIEYGKGNPFQVPNIETVIQSPTKEGKELANSNYLHSFPTRRSSDLDRKSVV